MLGNFLPPTCKKDIFDQLIFLNSHNKLDFYSNKPFFFVPPKNMSDKFNLINF